MKQHFGLSLKSRFLNKHEYTMDWPELIRVIICGCKPNEFEHAISEQNVGEVDSLGLNAFRN